MIRFLEDLHHVEHKLLKESAKFTIADFGLKQNPLYEAAQLKDEKTIEEM